MRRYSQRRRECYTCNQVRMEFNDRDEPGGINDFDNWMRRLQHAKGHHRKDRTTCRKDGETKRHTDAKKPSDNDTEPLKTIQGY